MLVQLYELLGECGAEGSRTLTGWNLKIDYRPWHSALAWATSPKWGRDRRRRRRISLQFAPKLAPTTGVF
jgi:hypothetical protein